MKIKFTIYFLTVFFYAFLASSLQAQDSTKSKDKKKEHSQFFIDKDGDGYNDNAPDHDGDGIPNGLDPDWQKLKKGKGKAKRRFVDLDGDGVDDNLKIGEEENLKMEKGLDEKGSSLEGKNQIQNQKGGVQKKKGKK